MDSTYSLKLPPKSYRRTIEELSVVIPDPVLKLKFLKQAINEYQKISAPGKPDPAIAEIAFQNTLLDKAEEIWPGSKKAATNSIHTDVIAASGVNLGRFNRLYKLRHAFGSAILVFLLLWISPAVSPLVKSLNFGALINQNPPQSKASHKENIIRKPIIDSRQFNVGTSHVKTAKFQNSTRQVLKYLQNPILLALTPWKGQNSTGNPIDNTPILLSKPSNIENYPPRSTIQSDKLPKPSEPVLEYFPNPVLAALIPQPSNNTRTNRGSKSAPAFSHPSEIKNLSSSTIIKSEQLQKETGWLPEGLQNHILLALASPVDADTKSDPILKSPLLSSLPPNNENQASSPSVYSSVYREGPAQVLKYFRNPILTALTSQQTKNAKPEQTSKKPLSTQKLQENENIPTFTAFKSDAFQKELEPALIHLQNPILLALSSQIDIYAKSDHIIESQLLPSFPPQSENHESSSIVHTTLHKEELGQALKYLQNPLLMALTFQKAISSKSDPNAQNSLSSLPTPNSENRSPSPVIEAAKYQSDTEQFPEYLKDPIWLVEKTPNREIYSNRLQIITTHTISNIPREYYRIYKNSNDLSVHSKFTDEISGIVYHASESDLYPFMPQMNHSILKYSKRLIKFLQRKKSYHYFIDRFGRVYRLVKEDHAAFHAGNSVWADDEEIYLNLNHAFIGICFEGKDFEEIRIENQKRGNATKSKATRLKPTGISSFNEAQLRSGKELTDWLRVKYKISQHNCVPHALISINPDKMLIGWHLDLCRGFPFAKFGLSNKYREPLPSIVEFGFRYDAYFKKIFNHDIWPAIGYSEEIIVQRAKNSDMQFAEYRESLHRRFSLYAEWNKKMFERKDQLAENLQKTMGR